MSVSFVRRTAAVALALPLLLSGCTKDDPVPKMPASSSPTSPTSEPTSDEPVEPTLPPEAQGKGNAAAEAFVRHYFAMVNYAQATGDTRGLAKLGLVSCRACEAGIDFIKTIYGRGGTNDGGEYTVLTAEVTGRLTATQKASIFYLDVTAEHTKQVVSGAGDLDKTYDQGQANWRYELTSGTNGWKVAQWDAS